VSGNVGVSQGGIQAVGGGIYNTTSGQLTVTNSTVAFNSAFVTGGIENNPSGTGNNITLRNTIVGNNGASFSNPDCRGTVGSGGFNLVQSTAGCTFATTTGDVTGLDPKLGQLTGVPAYHPLRLD